MRAIAIDANERGGLGSLLDEMHQVRARVFAGRLGWQVQIEEGRERDGYDALDTIYVLAVTNRGEVAGCARLLSATSPTMLARNGFDEIATATDVRFECILQRAGWPMTRLGGVELIGETMSVADIPPADRTSFEQVYPPGYCSDPRCLKRVAA